MKETEMLDKSQKMVGNPTSPFLKVKSKEDITNPADETPSMGKWKHFITYICVR